jgi:hypothetical protein
MMDTLRYLTWLKDDEGYKDIKLLSPTKWAAINQFMFTHAIIVGTVGNRTEYDDRWCYHDYKSAKAALDAWDGTGEPQGWHRHPPTGRRREAGMEEYINF